MGKTAILSIRIVADAKGAKRDMDQTSESVGKLEQGLAQAAAPAGVAVAAIGALGAAAASSASELQQSQGAVESVFQDQASTIIDASQRSADAVGLAGSEYQNLSVILGSQLKNMGTPMDEVATKTGDLITLGSDLAATFGGTTADAVAAISSLMRGERDPIERYGVSIKQADINARLAAEGLDGLTGDAAKAAESQVTLALLSEQTAAAQGQFARETDSAAGSQQIATAKWEDARAKLGEGLLPIVTAFAQAMSGAAGFVSQHSGAVVAAVAVIGGFAAAILAANAAISAYHTIQTVIKGATVAWSAAQGVLNAVMAANPITLIVVAIVALVAAVVLAYNKCEWFRNLVNSIWETIKSGAKAVWDWIKPVVDVFWGFVDAIKSAYEWVRDLFSNFHAPQWLTSILGWIGLTAGSGAGPGIIQASAGQPLAAPRLSRAALTGRAAPQVNNITNITVDGALDPISVARQIGDMLADYGVIQGGGVVA